MKLQLLERKHNFKFENKKKKLKQKKLYQPKNIRERKRTLVNAKFKNKDNCK